MVWRQVGERHTRRLGPRRVAHATGRAGEERLRGIHLRVEVADHALGVLTREGAVLRDVGAHSLDEGEDPWIRLRDAAREEGPRHSPFLRRFDLQYQGPPKADVSPSRSWV